MLANNYPDATFTPRLTFGTVAGYNDQVLGFVSPFTTIGGAFGHEAYHGGQDPYRLPESWRLAKPELDLGTPYNYVSTADIIGGNSGSPTINSKGELIGLIFDGNIHSIMGDFFYDQRLNRAVSVDSRAMIHTLEVIYKAKGLVSEILAEK